MDADSRKLRRITRSRRLGPPIFSPDGKRIAFTGGIFQNDIFIRNLDCFEQRQLTVNAGYNHGLAFRPNGMQIVFVRQDAYYEENNNIHMINSDGTGERQLTHTNRDSRPAFSPDGHHIVFVSIRNGQSSEIYKLDLESGEETQLTHAWPEAAPQIGPGPRNSHAKFSPNGEHIVFEAVRRGLPRAHQEIYVMKADGTEQTRLTHTTGSCHSPVYSPDGQKIAFVCRPSGSKKGYIHTVNADGTERTQWQASEDVQSIDAFGPDSRVLAFTARDAEKSDKYGQDFDIFTLNVQNGNAQRITDNTGSNRDAAFGPTARKFVFISDRDGAEAIYMREMGPKS